MVMLDVKIEGLKELSVNVDQLKASFSRTTLRTALRNAAKPVRTRAKAGVAVDQGDLRQDIKSKAKVTRDGSGYADVGFLRRSFHGRFVELGTSQQPARPFLRPALDKAESTGQIQDEFIGALNRTIAKQLGRLK